MGVAPEPSARRLRAVGAQVVVADEPPADVTAEIWRRMDGASRDEAAVLINRHLFGRLNTAARLPLVESTIRSWRPDLVLHEAAEYAPAIAARRAGLPHAQVAIGLSAVESGSLRLASPELSRYGDVVVPAIECSPYLTHLPASLDPAAYDDTRRFRRAALAADEPEQSWWPGLDGPIVYASLGTVVSATDGGRAVFGAIVSALAGLPVRALVTVGAENDPADWPAAPNVLVERWVDPAAIVPHASVVVCHGGSGTTFDALACGVPLVVIPFMADQPANARLVSGAGAGVVVDESGRFEVDRVRSAIVGVLGDPSFARAARRIAADIGALPTLDVVLDGLRQVRSS